MPTCVFTSGSRGDLNSNTAHSLVSNNIKILRKSDPLRVVTGKPRAYR